MLHKRWLGGGSVTLCNDNSGAAWSPDFPPGQTPPPILHYWGWKLILLWSTPFLTIVFYFSLPGKEENGKRQKADFHSQYWNIPCLFQTSFVLGKEEVGRGAMSVEGWFWLDHKIPFPGRSAGKGIHCLQVSTPINSLIFMESSPTKHIVVLLKGHKTQ